MDTLLRGGFRLVVATDSSQSVASTDSASSRLAGCIVVRHPCVCRNLFDGTAAEILSRETDAEGEAGTDAARWPVAWLLLQPLVGGPPHQPPAEAIVLPLRVDLTLPDFLTVAHDFDACMRRRWSPGQRFRMFFGGKRHARARTGQHGVVCVCARRALPSILLQHPSVHSELNGGCYHKELGDGTIRLFSGEIVTAILGPWLAPNPLTGWKTLLSAAAGVYYKGTIAAVRPRPAQDAPAEQQAAFDPWEAIQVEWDASRGHAAGECENVSPWEIERDPDDLVHAPEELRAPEEALPRGPRAELPAFSRWAFYKLSFARRLHGWIQGTHHGTLSSWISNKCNGAMSGSLGSQRGTNPQNDLPVSMRSVEPGAWVVCSNRQLHA